MQENYKVLPIASIIFKVLAWMGLVLGLISAVIIFAGMDQTGAPRWMGVITILAGAVYFLAFFTVAEAVSLLLDMNARIK